MADAFIQVPPQSTGLKLDTTELTVGANTVERERINIADGVSATAIATVTASNALKVDGSAVTQPVSITGNQAVNVAQIAAATTLTGNGTTGTGSQRVTIASDNTAFSVNAAQSGTWTARVVGNAGATLDSTIGAATAPTNALATGAVYQSTIPALTAGQAVAVECDTTGSTYVNVEGRKKSYSAFASFTPVAGDIAVMPGNATNVVRVTRVEVSLSTSGTAALEAVQLVKRSAADTAGTSAGMTAVPHDSAFASAVSAPLSYTAAPTLGTAVGTLRGVQFFDESATVTGANTWLWTFGERPATAIVLRGTAQQLCVNLGGVVATQTATVSFEWTEE